MKILFIGGMDITIHPNHRAHHFINFLEKFDINVDIVSMTTFYSGEWSANPWVRFQRGVGEIIKNPIRVINHRIGIEVVVRRLPGRLDAFFQALWGYLHLGPLAGKCYDLCIFGNPDNVLMAILLKSRGLVKRVIYDDWDYYPGFNRSWLWTLLTRYREHLCVSLADMIISVGYLLEELRKTQGANRTLVIPNGVDYQLFASAQEKKPHPPTLIYMGRIDKQWGVDISIEGFARVHDMIPKARYLIIGYNKGPYVHTLHKLVNLLGLKDSVIFIGPKKYNELPAFLVEADIGVAMHEPNDLMRYAFPLKVIEYMTAGLAVVGTGIGETEKIIMDSRAGKCVEHSSLAFAEAVLEIFNDKKALINYSNYAKNYAIGYNWDTLFSNLTATDFWQIPN